MALNDGEPVETAIVLNGACIYLAATSPSLVAALILEEPLAPGANAPVVVVTIDQAPATVRNEGIAAAIDGWWRDSCWFEYMRAHPQSCRSEKHFAIIKQFTGCPRLDDRPPKPLQMPTAFSNASVRQR